MTDFTEQLRLDYLCHDGSDSGIDGFSGYYTKSTCKDGQLTYTAYSDDMCKNTVREQTYNSIDCVYNGEYFGIDVYMRCEFTNAPSGYYPEDDVQDEEDWNDFDDDSEWDSNKN